MPPLSALTAVQLRRRCDPARFSFASTAEASGPESIIGQERAARAIEFGIEMPYPGYNVFATGPAGAGKSSIITRFLETKAATRPVPADWGYVHNFADPDRPRAVRLPPGGGVRLREQVNGLLGQVADALEKAFASDQYAEGRNALGRELDGQRTERFHQLDAVAREQGFTLVRTPTGMMVAPVKDGQPLTQEQFDALTETERETFSQRGEALQAALERTLRQVQDLEEAAQTRLTHLDQEIAAAAIRPFFERLAPEYAGWPDVLGYLAGIQAHLAEHTHDLSGTVAPGQAEQGAAGPANPMPIWLQPQATSPFDRYRLNVIVDNSGLQGAPVVDETNPTYPNLIGRVEMRAEFGTLVTDYRHIKAGALHRANGGYLLLDARVLLRQPLGWEALKQALRNARIRIEDLAQQMGVLAATTLTPEPIPLEVKVVLVGDPETYYALYGYDEQFEKLFKVRADFAVEMPWTSESEERIVRFIRGRCEEYGLPHFDASGVARVIEYSGRLVEDQRKLTTRFAHVSDVIQEAAFWAGRAGHTTVTAADVQAAIDERVHRSNQYEERMREMTADGTIMLDTAGAVVGQVNGLAVLALGDYAFGRPSRITCRTYQGRAGVINIEREARLSGRTHDKGMLILTGFLGGRFAQDKPLSLSASIAFEQSYEGVDGDSASSTELYALLSSLAELPIRQALAVTGSVNQHGEIQAIGGANAKIEGLLRRVPHHAGRADRRTGGAPPRHQCPHPDAARRRRGGRGAGAVSYLAGALHRRGDRDPHRRPGEARDADGAYPPDTVNGRVDRKLRELAEKLQSFGQPAKGNQEREKKNGDAPRPDEEPEPPQAPPPGEPDLPGENTEPSPD